MYAATDLYFTVQWTPSYAVTTGGCISCRIRGVAAGEGLIIIKCSYKELVLKDCGGLRGLPLVRVALLDEKFCGTGPPIKEFV